MLHVVVEHRYSDDGCQSGNGGDSNAEEGELAERFRFTVEFLIIVIHLQNYFSF
jgi:hypothetical protein